MKRTAWRKRLDAITKRMSSIEKSAELAAKDGKELRPMVLATYMHLGSSRLRALAIVTLEEFPEEKTSERRRLRLLAQEVLNNVTPNPEDPDHPMHAPARGKKAT